MRLYKGIIIERAGINSTGIRWTCLTPYGVLRADTLAGMKVLITHTLKRRSIT